MWTDIHWINTLTHGRLGTMARPRGHDWLENELAHMNTEGVEILVSALQTHEVFELGLTEAQLYASKAGIDLLSFPIPDRSCPEHSSHFIDTVQSLATNLREGKCIAIHCRQGIGRASLLAVGTLGALGYSQDDAWLLVSQARGREVPDTPEQRTWLNQLWLRLPA